MPNHKNMFGTFYGNSSRSGNSTSSRGMGARRSRNGGVTIGNGNLVPRAMDGGKGRRHQCNCWERDAEGNLTGGGTILTWCRGRQSCAQCCKHSFGENYTGAPSIQGVGGRRGRNGGSGFGGGSLRALGDKERRLKKKCLCNPPAGYEDLGSQQISCYQWRQCSNCCQSRFGENWSGQDLIQGVRRRR